MTLEAGRAYVELVPRLAAGWGAKVAGEVEAATTPILTRVGRRFDAIGDRMRATATRMSTFVTLPLVAAAAASFKLASDLNESKNKVEVVFGDMAAAVLGWSKQAATAFGMSRQEALESAGTFGNLFRAMKIGLPTAADMSKNLIELASDLASFNNADPKDVLESLRSGLVGEIEPLRRFGVNLTQARIEAKALELGLWDGIDPITAGAKAQASYALILEDTALAQGDFARTADGAANKQRILIASIKDAGAEIGTKLLPVGQRLIGFVLTLVRGFTDLSPAMQDIVLYAGLAAAAAGPLVYIFGALASIIGFILSPIGLVLAAIAALVFAANELGTDWSAVWEWVKTAAANAWRFIEKDVLPIARAILGAIGDGLRWLADNAPKWWSAITDAAKTVFDWLDKHVFPVVDKLVDAFVVGLKIIGAVIYAGVQVVIFIWDNFGRYIIAAVENAWDFIGGIIEAALAIIGGILDIFVGIFTLDFGRAWEGIKAVVVGVWDAIVNAVTYAINTVVNIIGAALTGLGIIWGAAWSVIGAVVGFVWDNVINPVIGAFGFAIGVVGAIFTGVKDAIVTAWNAVGDAISWVWHHVIKPIVDKVTSAFNTLIDIVTFDWGGNPANPNVPRPLAPTPIKKSHSGSIVAGAPGTEALRLVEAGQGIFTTEQMAALAPVGGAARTVLVEIDLHGATIIRERELIAELAEPMREAILTLDRQDGI